MLYLCRLQCLHIFKKEIMKNLFAILFIISSLLSCSSTENSITKSNKKVTDANSSKVIISGKYIILELNGDNLKNRKFKGQKPIILFNNEKMSYSTNIGCNQINGNYTIKGSNIKFMPGMATMMACPDNLESNYLKTLGEVDNYKIVNFKLQIYTGNDLKIVFLPLKK